MATPERMLHLDRGGGLVVPARAFELAGFRAWVTAEDFPEKLRACYVAGEVFLGMSPESMESHSKPKIQVTVGICRIVQDEDLGEVYPDGVHFTNVAAEISTEPDLLVVTWATLEAGRVRFVPKAKREDDFIELEGAPDLVLEVVSDSSVRKDLRLLRDGYARAGIPEYWVVDARGEEILFEILELVQGEYRRSAPAGAAQRSAVLGRSFTLTRSKNRVGRWSYRLES